MQIRSKYFLAVAAALCVPAVTVLAQNGASTAPDAGAKATAPAASTTPAAQTTMRSPEGRSTAVPANALPQDPSALVAPQGTGLVRPAGSGVKYVPPGTFAGPGGFPVEKPVNGPLPLSIDDAISLGLKRNYRLKYEVANQRAVRGYQGEIKNAIAPNLQFQAQSSAQELNLAALGFNPTKVGPLLSEFGIDPTTLKTIVKVNTTSVQLSLNQALFNMPDFELYRAIKPEFKAVDLNVANADEQLVQAVTTAYLKILADQANVRNAVAQETAAKALLDQATQLDVAGVGIKLDVLRAQVEYQQRQQAHVSAEAQLDKDGIQLNRIMGLPAGQQLDLIDNAPFHELSDINLDEARQTALTHRNDLLALQQSLIVASHELKAVRYQRLPTLAVNGFYGVLGETTGLYHGVFTAEGNLKVPVFREAAQRGEQATAEAQLQELRDQEENLRGTIEAQVRTGILDLQTASQLVKVAQSNVDLSNQVLSDARDRFGAGVTDNLEVVNAQASVTSADAQLVSALFQFNTAKVNLARATGVLQATYRSFLGM